MSQNINIIINDIIMTNILGKEEKVAGNRKLIDSIGLRGGFVFA